MPITPSRLIAWLALLTATLVGGIALPGLFSSEERALPTEFLSPPSVPAERPPIPKPAPVRLLFTGDIMLDRGVRLHMERPAEGRGDPNFPFDGVREYLTSFDAVVANLEGPVSDRGERVGSIYSFRMNPDVISALRNANIRAVSIANNHAWDYGRAAFEDTLRRFAEAGIGIFGGGMDEPTAYAPYILTLRGTRIALLGFTEFLPQVAAQPDRSGIAFADPEKIREAIVRAREGNDVVIASFHMGEEYQTEPVARVRALAHAAVDAGADLVVGHHPHVVGTGETYRGKEIYYSLGNFVFDQNFSTSTMIAGYLEVTVDGGKIVGANLRQGTINRNFQPCAPEKCARE